MEFTNVDISRLSGYSYISKYIYRDKTLSLKEMGLMSWFFSCPPDWTYTIKGMVAVHDDKKDCITNNINKLIKKKYLTKKEAKDEKGHKKGTKYTFYERPYDMDPSEDEIEFADIETDEENCNVRIEQLPVTIMSNYHLRDKNLSIKEKGLLSLLFSLPKNWVFSVQNITKLVADKEEAVSDAIKKLEEKKYLVRQQTRNAKGQMDHSIYTFYRMPYDIDRTTLEPKAENPVTVKPFLEKPSQEKPLWENPTQIKTIKTKTINNKDYSNKHPLHQEAKIEEPAPTQTPEQVMMMIKARIGYDDIIANNERILEDPETTKETLDKYFVSEPYLDKFVNTMTNVYLSKATEIPAGRQGTVSKYNIIEAFERFEYRDIREIVNRVCDVKPQNVQAFFLRVIANY